MSNTMQALAEAFREVVGDDPGAVNGNASAEELAAALAKRGVTLVSDEWLQLAGARLAPTGPGQPPSSTGETIDAVARAVRAVTEALAAPEPVDMPEAYRIAFQEVCTALAMVGADLYAARGRGAHAALDAARREIVAREPTHSRGVGWVLGILEAVKARPEFR